MALPDDMTEEGLVPRTPAAIRAELDAAIAASNPGFTSTLPGSLVEDVLSTDVGAVVEMDQARVETVGSLTPRTANPWLLRQLGAIYGVDLGRGSNTSVYVTFSGPPGFVIARGFTVSDGTYQYVVQGGGIIGTDGSSLPLFAIAALPGIWPVAAGTVTVLITSVPDTLDPELTVVNASPGTPGSSAQTEEAYRAQVLQAGLATATGTPTLLRTLLAAVPDVQARLISVRAEGDGYEVIVGGGDPYQVAYAIFEAIFFLPGLVGSTIGITAATAANPVVITTDLNHGLEDGQADVEIEGVVGMVELNGAGPFTVNVLTEKTFQLVGIDGTMYTAYVSGGVVMPNDRNVVVSIDDYPDTYDVPFVNPPQQTVTIDVTWNTSALNFVSPAAIAQLAAGPIVDYINSIPVGAPINVLTLDATFREAVSSALAPELVTRLVFAIEINGVSTAPNVGTVIVVGDPESYFFAELTDVSVVQG